MNPTQFQQQVFALAGQALIDVSHKQDFHDPNLRMWLRNDILTQSKVGDDTFTHQYKDVITGVQEKLMEINDLVASLKRPVKAGWR